MKQGVWLRSPFPWHRNSYEVIDVKDCEVTCLDEKTHVSFTITNSDMADDIIDYCNEKGIDVPHIKENKCAEKEDLRLILE